MKVDAGVAWGFGGKMVSFKNGKEGEKREIKISNVVTIPGVIERAVKLEAAEGEGKDGLRGFVKTMENDADTEEWKLLSALFEAGDGGGKEHLVRLLGFSKEEVEAKVESAVESFRKRVEERRAASKKEGEIEKKEVEERVKEVTHTTDGQTLEKEAEEKVEEVEIKSPTIEESKETSLFGDDSVVPTTPGTDFFSSLPTLTPKSALPAYLHSTSSAHEITSVAATMGSRPASVTSETIKRETFRIYPSGEDEGDRLITRALVLGDFKSAVELCLSSERWADAILLAVKGGGELLARTQKVYFEKMTLELPYLRLFQSIVTDDLNDVVQNADLTEWQEIFVVLCTFAKEEEFGHLARQLGERLEFQYVEGGKKEDRKNAMLCYLAAGKIEKAVDIWSEEMKEEEAEETKAAGVADGKDFEIHAKSL